MRCTIFEYSGRFAHFLRAEANASAPSYPLPPRTVLLGLTGAVLGLEKDTAQDLLRDGMFAVAGGAACTHWHSTKLRKKPPASLPCTVTQKSRGSQKDELNTIICQEWLIKPKYRVWAVLPEPHGQEFEQRIRERRWHFTPCLGLSEMFADLALLASEEAIPLDTGEHDVLGVMRRSQVDIRLDEACERGVGVQSLRMPRDVTPGRSFTHEAYFRELRSAPVPVRTRHAWQVGDEKVMWL